MLFYHVPRVWNRTGSFANSYNTLFHYTLITPTSLYPLFFSLPTNERCGKLLIPIWNTLWPLKMMGKMIIFLKGMKCTFFPHLHIYIYIFIFKTTLSPDMCWAFTRSLIIILFEVSLDIIHCINQIEKKRKKICNLIFSETPGRKTNNKNPKHKNKSWMCLANLSDVKWKKKLKIVKVLPVV